MLHNQYPVKMQELILQVHDPSLFQIHSVPRMELNLDEFF